MQVYITKTNDENGDEELKTSNRFFGEDEALGDILIIRAPKHNYYLVCKKGLIELFDGLVLKENASDRIDTEEMTVERLKNGDLRACEGEDGRYIQHETGRGVRNHETLRIKDEEITDKSGFRIHIDYNKFVGFVPFSLYKERKVTMLQMILKDERKGHEKAIHLDERYTE